MRDGHTLCVSLKLKHKATKAELEAALASYVPPLAEVAGLPSAPKHFVEVRSEVNRPQPRLDRDSGTILSCRAQLAAAPCPPLCRALVCRLGKGKTHTCACVVWYKQRLTHNEQPPPFMIVRVSLYHLLWLRVC